MSKRTILTLAVLAGSISFGKADETFSRWSEVTGVSNVQYRWKSRVSNCEVELRDTDSEDRKYYEGKVNFISGHDDRWVPIIIAHFTYPGEIENQIVTFCDKVTDVILNEKR